MNAAHYGILLVILLLGAISFSFDQQAVAFVRSIHNSALDSFFVFITQIVTVIVAVLILSFVLYRTSNRKSIAPMWCACGMTAAFIYITKFFIIRQRPFLAMNFAPLVSATASSFPSNHTGFVFAALPFLRGKKYWLWLSFALLIGFSRVYAGVHYPSDVIFGGLIGYGLGWLIREWWCKWSHR